MAININIPKPVIDYNDLDNKPTLVTDHSQLNLDDGTNPHGTTASDVGAVPYTGATTDVDLGNNDLSAEGIKIKGTAGNGHLNMKHQSSNPTAGGQETVIFAGADGEPRFKNDGNAVEQFASREWVGLQGFQTTPIVVNSNITAQNDRVYHVVANATFTDPTPVEGRGYVVFLRNGTVTIGGSPFTNNSIYYRIFHSGSWLTYRFDNINSLSTNFNATYVPQSRTINGLDLSVNRTLTTADINDSANKRYVTDAEKTVIGNTSGTNTGDQDLSGLVGKSDYTPAHSLLAQQSGTGSPTSVPIGTNEILGRLSGGGADIKGLSTSEVKGLLDLSGTNTGDQTFITPRVQSVSSSATVTPTSTNDIVRITAQAEALTLANPTGTFLEGQSLIIRIKDNGTARTIGYGSDYRAIGVTLPTTTVANKTTYLGCIWNETDSKLDIVGVCTQA